jgi:hypothetical protein
MTVSDEYLFHYNKIIRNEGEATEKLEKDGLFPLIRVHFDIAHITPDDYAKIAEYSTNNNAQTILNLIGSFSRDWIFNKTQLATRLNEVQEPSLQSQIAYCLQPKIISIKPLEFLDELEKEPCRKDIRDYISLYGIRQIPLNEDVTDLRGYSLKIHLLANSVKMLYNPTRL